jgi:hypothetical protein
MTSSEQDNLPRYFSSKPPFYEVYFLKFHLLDEGLAFWIRYTLHAPIKGAPYACLWAFVLDQRESKNSRGATEVHPIDSVRMDSDRFKLQMGKSVLSQDELKGKINKEGFALEWNLQFSSLLSPSPLAREGVRILPYNWMYRFPFPKTKYLIPNPSVLFSGRLVYQGREYQVKEAPGDQAHIWGREHAARWGWGHCNTFQEDPQAIFEGLSAQVRVGPLQLPFLPLIYIRLFGREYKFSGVSHWLKNKSSCDLKGWQFEVTQNEERFVGKIWSDSSQMIGVRYTDPNESYRFCNHNEWARMQLDYYRLHKGNWFLEASLHSEAASYEWVDSVESSSIEMKVLG